MVITRIVPTTDPIGEQAVAVDSASAAAVARALVHTEVQAGMTGAATHSSMTPLWMTRTLAATPGGEMTVAAVLASAAAAARAGVQVAARAGAHEAARAGAHEAALASTTAAAAHVTGTAVEWVSAGNYRINMDREKPRRAGLFQAR